MLSGLCVITIFALWNGIPDKCVVYVWYKYLVELRRKHTKRHIITSGYCNIFIKRGRFKHCFYILQDLLIRRLYFIWNFWWQICSTESLVSFGCFFLNFSIWVFKIFLQSLEEMMSFFLTKWYFSQRQSKYQMADSSSHDLTSFASVQSKLINLFNYSLNTIP